MKRFLLLLAIATLLAAVCFAQSPVTPSPAPSVAVSVPAIAPITASCLIVKHKGMYSGRFILAVAVSPGARYDLVDSYGVRGTRMTYKGQDLELLQNAHVKVVVLQDKYLQPELDAARASCMNP